jgi:hypothetical protein
MSQVYQKPGIAFSPVTDEIQILNVVEFKEAYFNLGVQA